MSDINLCLEETTNANGRPYICQKDKGHTGNHVSRWKEKGIVIIDGEKVTGDIELMTWW